MDTKQILKTMKNYVRCRKMSLFYKTMYLNLNIFIFKNIHIYVSLCVEKNRRNVCEINDYGPGRESMGIL